MLESSILSIVMGPLGASKSRRRHDSKELLPLSLRSQNPIFSLVCMNRVVLSRASIGDV